jgi:hypothetical protein
MMNISEKKTLMVMVMDVLAAYGKKLPEGALAEAWWNELREFPLSIVGMALASYKEENAEFAPVPAGVAGRCRKSDGRPGAEEAWAIAITSKDESDTVVWTQECAAAFAACSSVLDMGDEVGARMAFKEIYARLVLAARAARQPAQWTASLGWDITKCTGVLAKAQTEGLLTAPTVAALLPPPEAAGTSADTTAKAQIADIKNMLARMNAEKQREIDLHAQRERDSTAEAKRLTNEKVAQYKRIEST